ncbi:MAG: hypothetical protein F6J93_40565 [Oscillatoria sp. SIO1A7]|nr:hypothetical protein [Oscillatoria sp. SIO1A7]
MADLEPESVHRPSPRGKFGSRFSVYRGLSGMNAPQSCGNSLAIAEEIVQKIDKDLI